MTVNFDKAELKERSEQFNATIGDFLNEVFTPFTSLGAYSKIFIDRQGNVLCHECAKKEFIENHASIDYDVYWEGDTIQCDECQCDIESAYGPLEK